MNIPVLLQALDNEDNSSLLNLTHKKIREIKINILRSLEGITKKDIKEMMQKLEGYRYVDGMNELKYGSYLRWISLIDMDEESGNPLYQLNKGGIFCDFKIKEDGVYVVYKNFYHKHYQFKIENYLIFQKLTIPEQVLLNALDHLERSDGMK